MRELTKAERHSVYKYALERLKIPYTYSMCDCIAYGVKEMIFFDEKMNYRDVPDHFPEFASKEPKVKNEKNNYWFLKSDKESRIKILTACIEETKP